MHDLLRTWLRSWQDFDQDSQAWNRPLSHTATLLKFDQTHNTPLERTNQV